MAPPPAAADVGGGGAGASAASPRRRNGSSHPLHASKAPWQPERALHWTQPSLR
tara:strand:+ start:266 stop:427 length:162 start_codon:yes stop_codon:yes gene_type:complete